MIFKRTVQQIQRLLSAAPILVFLLMVLGSVVPVAAQPAVNVDKLYDSNQGVPGQEVIHQFLVVDNPAANADTYNLTVGSTNGWSIELRTAGGQVLGQDTNGDGTWESVFVDTNNDGIPDTGSIEAGSSETYSMFVTIPVGATAGVTDTETLTATSITSPNPSDSESVLTLVLDSNTTSCNCGYGDGRMSTNTGVSITTSGTLNSGWDAVFADLDNNTCDGGFDNTNTYQPQPDLDAPVQSTGRDLIHFAFTWDSSNVYTYTARAASTSNIQNFVYYADTDNDGYMEDGEPVIVVAWQGNNREVDIFLGDYNAIDNAVGDPMLDSDGLGDGYSLPGTIDNLPSPGHPDYTGKFGLSGGLGMQWSVSWADLGVPPNTAFTFHVSALNSRPGASSFTHQIDDNMGGCGGGGVSTQYADLTFVDDESVTTAPLTTVCLPHVLTHKGNGEDSFTFSSSVSGDFTPDSIVIFQDLGTVGTLDGPDVDITATGTGDLDPDEAMNLLICYTLGADDLGNATVTTIATSTYDPNVDEDVVDTITSSSDPSFMVVKSVLVDDGNSSPGDDFYLPGASVIYKVVVTNSGAGSPDEDTFVFKDALPDELTLYVGDYVGGNGGPVDVQNGATSSTLTYTFSGLTSVSDSIVFKNSSGTAIIPDAAANAGFDDTVRSFEITPTGTFAPWSGSGGQPSITFEYRAKLK